MAILLVPALSSWSMSLCLWSTVLALCDIFHISLLVATREGRKQYRGCDGSFKGSWMRP